MPHRLTPMTTLYQTSPQTAIEEGFQCCKLQYWKVFKHMKRNRRARCLKPHTIHARLPSANYLERHSYYFSWRYSIKFPASLPRIVQSTRRRALSIQSSATLFPILGKNRIMPRSGLSLSPCVHLAAKTRVRPSQHRPSSSASSRPLIHHSLGEGGSPAAASLSSVALAKEDASRNRPLRGFATHGEMRPRRRRRVGRGRRPSREAVTRARANAPSEASAEPIF